MSDASAMKPKIKSAEPGFVLVPRKPSTETLWAINERKPQTVREVIEMFIELEGK